jgi:hypothetical protein
MPGAASQLAAAGVLDLPPHQVLGEGVDAAVLLAGADGVRGDRDRVQAAVSLPAVMHAAPEHDRLL